VAWAAAWAVRVLTESRRAQLTCIRALGMDMEALMRQMGGMGGMGGMGDMGDMGGDDVDVDEEDTNDMPELEEEKVDTTKP